VIPPPLFAALFTFGRVLIETEEGVAKAETVTVRVRCASGTVEVVDKIVAEEIVDATGVVADSGSAMLEGEREDAFSAAVGSMAFEEFGVPSHAIVQSSASSEDGR
jgi:uncharacterized 2Fe-2S/4Fe-4S cluster protein (DUF4445 family)